MADEPGVEDGVEVGPPVRSLFGEPPEAGPLRHGNLVPDPPPRRRVGSGLTWGDSASVASTRQFRPCSTRVPSGDIR